MAVSGIAGAAYVSDEDFGDLLALLFPDPEARCAMLTAYMDESATPDDEHPMIAVGGGVGTGLQWERLLRAWRSVLDPEGIEIFHTSEYESPGGREGSIYKTWPDQKLRDFGNALIRAIQDNKPEMAFVACVPVFEFNQVRYPDGTSRHLRLDDRYFLCAYLCLEQISLWAGNLFGPSSRITYFFETDGPHERQMRDAYKVIAQSDSWSRRLKFWREPTLSPKDGQPGLQIADKFVYEGAKHASHFLVGNPPPQHTLTLPDGTKVWRTRYPTEQLVLSGLDVHTRMYTAQDIEKVFAEWKQIDET